jgi:hypothetical protein
MRVPPPSSSHCNHSTVIRPMGKHKLQHLLSLYPRLWSYLKKEGILDLRWTDSWPVICRYELSDEQQEELKENGHWSKQKSLHDVVSIPHLEPFFRNIPESQFERKTFHESHRLSTSLTWDPVYPVTHDS